MVREAREGDAAVVAELLDQLGYPASADQARRRLAALGADDRVLLAGDGLGLVALHRIPRLAEGDAFVRITALVVRREARGRRVGHALLEAAERTTRQWGCVLIEVSSGRRPERESAHRFYRTAGFADTSSKSVRYWKRLHDRHDSPASSSAGT